MPDALDVFLAYYATISAIEWPLSSKPEERFGSSGAYRIGLRPATNGPSQSIRERPLARGPQSDERR